MNSGNVRAYTFRLKPGEDLKISLQTFAKTHHIGAGAVVSCAGSLKEVALRLANQKGTSKFSGYHEIVSLSGTISEDGAHLHMSVSDDHGKTLGGHLVEGNIIYTTAEIMILDQLDIKQRREIDPATGFKELIIDGR